MKIIKATRGSGLDLQNAIEDKIAQLNGRDVTSASNIDDTTRDRYLHNLIGDVEASLKENGIQHLSFDQDDRNLYVTVGDTLEEYQVPFKDLSFDFDNIDKDEKYIVDEITSSCDTYNKETVKGSRDNIPDDAKFRLYEQLENLLSEEVNDFAINHDDKGITIDISDASMESGYITWYFPYEELNLEVGTEDAYEYIANTIYSYLDDTDVDENWDEI